MKPCEGEWVCTNPNCDFTREVQDDDHEVITTKRESRERVIIEEEINTLPVTKARCPECGNNKAYWRLEQTRAADEPETRIYRCTNCNHTWREY